MKILFDYQVFNLQRYGGISRYFVTLAEELNKLPDTKATIFSPYFDNEHLTSANPRYVKTWGRYARKLFNNRFVSKTETVNKITTARFLSRHPKTILHETYYTHRTPCSNPKVVTVHDMIDELFFDGNPEIQNIIDKKKQALFEAERVIAVSEYTKTDLLKFYPELSSKTSVVYHGVNTVMHETKPFRSSRPYILFVGLRKKYKNFGGLLKAYAADRNLRENYEVLFFGGGDPQPNERQLITELGISSNVRFLSGDDDALAAVYAGASVLAYVSLYEGFGLPVLEAMRSGCPVLCANSSSLPEVAGNAAAFCNGEDPGDIAEVLNKVLTIEDYRQSLISLGKERVKKFSWQKCAAQTRAVYELCT